MSLRIRRGTNAQRATTPLDLGELVYTTDTKQLYVGNGIDAGGTPIIRLGTGLAWADAQCTTIIATGVALQVVADTSPHLGGSLVLSGYNITGVGDIDITGSMRASGIIDTIWISGNTAGVKITANNNLPVNIIGIHSGNPIYASIKVAKGTISAQTTTAAGDNLGGINISGYNGSVYKGAALVTAAWEAGAVLTDALPKSTLTLGAGGGASTLRQATLNSSGVFTAPTFSAGDGTAGSPSIRFSTDGSQDTGFFHPGDGIVCTSINAVEKVRVDSGGMRVTGFMKVGGFSTVTLPSPPEAGMIVLDTTTNQFKGYNGTAWVVLG